ncbi:hypothetical protein BpHYR1_022974 [Brachionus plicatilis]|uniref:Uncharacterized protein n=1 Tax=Brachionus plicatilis TaxID=10195 RepID=A0A3M7RBC1_BRAPC|nr:hypothetical protein BpHYR1_022974 [Brachionus plicatilis]
MIRVARKSTTYRILSSKNSRLLFKIEKVSNKGTKLSRLIFLFPKRVSIIENSLYRKFDLLFQYQTAE